MSDPRYPHGQPPGLYLGDRQRPQGWPKPQPFDPRGEWTNPAGTVPFPAPKTWPKAFWSSQELALSWSAGVGEVFRTASWRTPVFDFRPELRHADGPRASAVPIYRPGGGGHLYVQIFGIQLEPTALEGLEVQSTEFANVWSAESQTNGAPSNVPQIIEPEDVSDQFFALVPSSILVFDPPGGGAHIRYWSLQLTFNKLIGGLADPPLRIAAAVY